VEKSLYIISDSIQTVDSVSVPYLSFNEEDVYSKESPIISINSGDTLKVWIYNLDSIIHHFAVLDFSDTFIIPAGDSIYLEQVFMDEGLYIYHDPLNYPKNTYLGLAGMIVVNNLDIQNFYWNIKEHNAQWNFELVNNIDVDWDNYAPKYFTINGNSNPHINSDSLARVIGSVGDTLYLNIANTGLSVHSMHLHGYHAEIMYSSMKPSHIGRIKDTFPVYPMETLVLKIVPHQPGEYPIHDHNLAAITGNNIYPNGMFTTILITP
jgi:FtsP/CotA-like multicopper oxidase with cupredoxin domain